MKNVFLVILFVAFGVGNLSAQLNITDNSTVFLVTQKAEAETMRTNLRSLTLSKAMGMVKDDEGRDTFIVVVSSIGNKAAKKAKGEIETLFPEAKIKEEDIKLVNEMIERQRSGTKK